MPIGSCLVAQINGYSVMRSILRLLLIIILLPVAIVSFTIMGTGLVATIGVTRGISSLQQSAEQTEWYHNIQRHNRWIAYCREHPGAQVVSAPNCP